MALITLGVKSGKAQLLKLLNANQTVITDKYKCINLMVNILIHIMLLIQQLKYLLFQLVKMEIYFFTVLCIQIHTTKYKEFSFIKMAIYRRTRFMSHSI